MTKICIVTSSLIHLFPAVHSVPPPSPPLVKPMIEGAGGSGGGGAAVAVAVASLFV